MKKLYKSDTNKVLSGVIGGIGEYYDIDPTILRLAYIVIAIFTAVFQSILAYIIASLIVPSRQYASHDIHHVDHTEKTEENK